MVVRGLLVFAVALGTFWLTATAFAEQSVAELTGQLKSGDVAGRIEAAKKLGTLGEKAMPAVSQLAAAIADPDPHVRRAALGALEQLKPDRKITIPLFVKLLSDADPAVAVTAMQTLADEGAGVVDFLTEALQDEDARYWAALVLADIGPEARAAVPALLDALKKKDLDPEVRRELVIALGEIGPDAKSALPQLIEMLEDEDRAIVLSATYAIGKLGPPAAAATPKLRAAMAGDDPFHKVVAAWAMKKLHPDDKFLSLPVAKILVDGLFHETEKGVRLASAKALVDLKLGPPVVLPLVKKAIEKTPREVLAESLDVVTSLGADVAPGLARLLSFEKTRLAAARNLARLGPKAKVAVPELVAALESADAETKEVILNALANIGEPAKTALPAAKQLLTHEDEGVRYAAVFLLGELGTAGKEAKAELHQQLASEDPFFRTCCAWALVQVDPSGDQVAKDVLPLLIEALKHQRAFVRAEAAKALGLLGEKARIAVPALKTLLNSETDQTVRSAATEALKRIES